MILGGFFFFGRGDIWGTVGGGGAKGWGRPTSRLSWVRSTATPASTLPTVNEISMAKIVLREARESVGGMCKESRFRDVDGN